MENYNRIVKDEFRICYLLDNKLHRLDGSAIEYYYGHKEWWFKGEYIDCTSQEEFERIIKLKLFW
jgi:hypothetical protein